MKFRNTSSIRKRVKFIGLLFFAAFLFGISNSFLTRQPVYAIPGNEETEQTNTSTPNDGNTNINENSEQNNTQQNNNATQSGNNTAETGQDICKQATGPLSWFFCAVIEKTASFIDGMLDSIKGLLDINPVAGARSWIQGMLEVNPDVVQGDSAIHQIWEYVRVLTNIVFIGFFLVVIYSQLTGYGISNYGIKKALPKVVLVAVLINLSYLICVVAIDVSNVVGNGLRGVFSSVQEAVLNSTEVPVNEGITIGEVVKAFGAGGTLAIGGGAVVGAGIALDFGLFWMLIPTILGGLVSVVAGFITIALRQAVVAILVMVSPLAFVAYMLPNTEEWFKKWKKLFTQMLVFYPAFSLLFGASSLASFAIMQTAIANGNGFWLILGLGVQVFPLFYSVKLMKMSDTFLGNINAKMQGLATPALEANRAWADSHRRLTMQRTLASGVTPSARLLQHLSDRKISREESIESLANYSKLRGQWYAVGRKYRGGIPTRELEGEYKRQAKGMEYQEIIERHKNNMDKGLGDLEVVKANAGGLKKARLQKLDMANVLASDNLKIEAARGEKIAYENAKGFRERMENAINVHFDDENQWNEKYKVHDIKDRSLARSQYKAMTEIMEGDVWGTHFVAASAAQGYDTQKKIIETKMQKYFELTPPTKDVEYRLGELTKLSQDELAKGKKAADNIDAILPGLRILNQRGDTDIVQRQMENLLNKEIGGGIELGTHASQALASFLMFDVKDNDPFLRRFGKYINLETARAYNANDRKVMDVTYDEYVRGYHDGEPDVEKYPGGRMYAKKGMRQLTEGTSLDNIERTALSNLDESLKRAYGFKKDAAAADWDVEGYLKKREEIQTAFEPAFLSASLKWLSGSEQINSGVKFWTGYELKQKKDKDGKLVVDENGDPEYDLSAVWNDPENGFRGREEEMEKYYRRKTRDYIKDQTTGQILGMRTDYRDAIMEHFAEMFLEDSSEEETSDERKAEYAREQSEIQTRYRDRNPDEAKRLREKDLKELKTKMASAQIRKTLSETGKLEQIYRTRRSGAANNAKDWWRKWIGLDDEVAINAYLEKNDKKHRDEFREAAQANSSDEDNNIAGGFDRVDRAYFATKVRGIYDAWRGFDEKKFYEESKKWVEKTLDGVGEMILHKYTEYYNANPGVDDHDLMEYLQKLLLDSENY